jgi:hypothetical protein
VQTVTVAIPTLIQVLVNSAKGKGEGLLLPGVGVESQWLNRGESEQQRLEWWGG